MDKTRHPGWTFLFFFCIQCTREFCNMWSKGQFETPLCLNEKCLMILYAHKTLKHLTAQRELTESTHDVIQCTGHSKATFQIKFWSTTSKTNLTYKTGQRWLLGCRKEQSQDTEPTFPAELAVVLHLHILDTSTSVSLRERRTTSVSPGGLNTKLLMNWELSFPNLGRIQIQRPQKKTIFKCIFLTYNRLKH